MAAGEEAMAVAVAAAAEAGAVGAVPRDYNFAADVLQKEQRIAEIIGSICKLLAKHEA